MIQVQKGLTLLDLQRRDPGLVWTTVLTAPHPPSPADWLYLAQKPCAYQRSSKEVHSHLESVLLTVSEWEQAVGGERRRVRGGKLHRDFFFFSPVTNRQFTPQRIWNQNLIKILNK